MTHDPHKLRQPAGLAKIRRNPVSAFGENLARTAAVPATETPHAQKDLDGEPLSGQILQPPYVAAVPGVGQPTACGTARHLLHVHRKQEGIARLFDRFQNQGPRIAEHGLRVALRECHRLYKVGERAPNSSSEPAPVLPRPHQPNQVRGRAIFAPALVLSLALYNNKTSLMICCPMTAKIKNYPFEVLIAGTPSSAVLADRVKGLDWRSRKAAKKGEVSVDELADVRAKIRALIG